MTPEEKKESRRRARLKYQMSPKYRAYLVRYYATDSYKSNVRSRNASDAAKQHKADWRISEKGKTYMKAWRRSSEGKALVSARKAEYRKLGKLREYAAQYYSNENNKATIRKYQLRAGYGITPATYAEMLAEQSGVCKVCGGVSNDGKRLSVDHCHETGKVRGLLCNRRNSALGQTGDNVYRLLQLIDYLLDRG